MAPQNDGKPQNEYVEHNPSWQKNTDFLSHPQAVHNSHLACSNDRRIGAICALVTHLPAMGTTRNPNPPSFATAV